MKKIAAGIIASALAVVIFQPAAGHADKQSIAEIDKQLKQLQQDVQNAKSQQQQAQAQGQEALHYKNKTTEYLEYVLGQIEINTRELDTINGKIDATETSLKETAAELAAAEERVESRQKLLESRVRLMYTDGSVSYLEVLMSSTSFSDFIDRADSLISIVDQDQDLLVQHKQDKELVVSKKLELEGQYALAKQLYAELEDKRTALEQNEAEKQALIAHYDQEIQESDELSAEQEEKLVQLATERSELQQQKNKLEAEEAARKAAAAKAAAERRAAAAKAAAAKKSSASASVLTYSGNGPLGMPISSGRISSGYGPRTHPVTGEVGKMHTGVDFAVPQGTSIYAAGDGTVILAEWWSGYGNTVIIDHGDGMWTLYAHIRNGGIKVSNGDKVKRGQFIAESGSTGRSTGPHLHFEVRINGKTVNPMPYL